MSETALQVQSHQDLSAQLMESVLLGGDLSKLNAPDRVNFYRSVCESIGLNPLTKPFEYILLNGKLRLYATKDCTEQLRKRDGVSIQIVSREVVEDIFVVTAHAVDRAGRTDESVGAVPVGTLKGEARANAIMKAETKAKRRVTLSICGLGMLDASETDSIPDAQRVPVSDTGEIQGDLSAAEQMPEGSKEKQEQVKQLKLEAAKKTAPKPRPADTSRDWFKVMLQGFNDMKEEIGDENYYRVLGNNGFEHANEIPNRDTALAIYKEMGKLRQQQQEIEPDPAGMDR